MNSLCRILGTRFKNYKIWFHMVRLDMKYHEKLISKIHLYKNIYTY